MLLQLLVRMRVQSYVKDGWMRREELFVRCISIDLTP